jgi:hypothetical protein
MDLPPLLQPPTKWDRFSQFTKSTSDNLLRDGVAHALRLATIEGELAMAKKRFEMRLIFLINGSLLIVALYFRDYAQLSKSIALSIYVLLLLRMLTGVVSLIRTLHRTRHIGVPHYTQRFFQLGGLVHPHKAFRACMRELFDMEYVLFMKKPLAKIHEKLSDNNLTISNEDIFNYFYSEALHRFWFFFKFNLIQFILTLLSYSLMGWIIRKVLFNTPV